MAIQDTFPAPHHLTNVIAVLISDSPRRIFQCR